MDLGNNIKRRREALNLTQQELAAKVKVNNTMICQIECGTKVPNVMLLKAISDIFGCTLDDLVKE